METFGGFSASPAFIEGLMSKQALFQDRKAKMPEGSTTTRLFKDGFPRLVNKSIEELSELIRAFEYQHSDDVNLEASQLIYYLMVSMVMIDRGSIDGVFEKFQEMRAQRKPPTWPDIGLPIQELGKNLGEAYNALMVEAPTTDEVNHQIATVFLAIDDMMVFKRKGNWTGVLEML